MPEPNNGTLREWSDYLHDLLIEASAASGSGDSAQMRTCQDKLNRFEQRSPLAADELDKIALSTVVTLHVANAERRTKELQDRIEEFRRIRKLIDRVDEEAKT
jgi:hypothetical protein